MPTTSRGSRRVCLAFVSPTESFQIRDENDYCYADTLPTNITVSPEAEWFVAHGRSTPDRPEELIRTHLSQDLISPNLGSMANLGVFDIQDWLWETDDTLLYRTSEGWFRLDLYTSAIQELPIPAGSSAYPVPRAVGG